jgi:hypothetical protein
VNFFRRENKRIQMRFSLRTLLILLAASPPLAAIVYWKNKPQISRAEQIQICDAVLNDLLNNPDLQDSRDFYGTTGDKQVALVSYSRSDCNWPSFYRPAIPGYIVLRINDGAGRDDSKPRTLGFRLDKFNPWQKTTGIFDAPVCVTIMNAGGSSNGGVVGGCNVFYGLERNSGRWTVQYQGALDP